MNDYIVTISIERSNYLPDIDGYIRMIFEGFDVFLVNSRRFFNKFTYKILISVDCGMAGLANKIVPRIYSVVDTLAPKPYYKIEEVKEI